MVLNDVVPKGCWRIFDIVFSNFLLKRDINLKIISIFIKSTYKHTTIKIISILIISTGATKKAAQEGNRQVGTF